MSKRRPWPPEVRAELLARVAAGTPCATAANQLGVPRATAHQWATDPDGSHNRARKRRYDTECVDCGAWVSGHSGRRDEPRCLPCIAKINGEARTVWTRELVIARIREWVYLYGEPPAICDRGPSMARSELHDEQRAVRFEQANGHWPWFTVVVRRFGSWNAALEAAGFTPRANHGGSGNQFRRRRMRRAA